MKSFPFPLSGGSYRMVDGALVREDDTPAPAAGTPSAEPADPESTDTASAPRGRRIRPREE